MAKHSLDSVGAFFIDQSCGWVRNPAPPFRNPVYIYVYIYMYMYIYICIYVYIYIYVLHPLFRYSSIYIYRHLQVHTPIQKNLPFLIGISHDHADLPGAVQGGEEVSERPSRRPKRQGDRIWLAT